LALVALVGFTLFAKNDKSASLKEKAPEAVSVEKVEGGSGEVSTAEPKTTLPKLLDLGADKCIPCKMMAPILEELKSEYQGRMEVVFIDVWKNPGAGDTYGIQSIPTQIFFDASGKELFRHTGFFGKEDILAKWKELGIEFDDQPQPATSVEASDASPK
jgi:thioredoxin 1